MIFPDKLTNPNNCLVFYGFLIFKYLKRYKKTKYTSLEMFAAKHVSDFSQNLFISALDFLYALEKLEYDIEDDSVELIYEVK